MERRPPFDPVEVMGPLALAMLAAVVLATSAFIIYLSRGGGGKEAKPAEAAAEVHVHLNEWTVEPGVISGGGGAVKFTIEAHNHGGIAHELVVIRTDLDPASLPVKKAKVDVAQAGELVGQVGSDKLTRNATADVTLDLEPESYVFICNIAGHYQQGMYAPFRVE